MALTKVITGVTDLNQAQSTNGLKFPTGSVFAGTPEQGMIRNDQSQSSETSSSTMQFYNGTAWKNFVNKTFIPPLVVDFLVVAGGGGGGRGTGGGGGAGGLKTTTTYSGSETPLAASLGTAYTVEVGTPGAGGGGTGGGNPGGDGTNSKFGVVGSEIISTGGGGGAANNGIGRAGGSGGGSGAPAGTPGGTATPSGQGNDGGQAIVGTFSSNQRPAGGGGGAGTVGQEGQSNYNGGNGGSGLEVNIIGGTGNFYAGGGGGGTGSGYTAGTGGSSIGGNGGAGGGTPTAGTINTGSGGGGGGFSSGVAWYNGAAGGSGIVIVRYPSNYTATFSAGVTQVEDTSISGVKINTITVAGAGDTITFS